MIETQLSNLENGEGDSLARELGPLGEEIAAATLGYDDVNLSGAFSRSASLNESTKITLILKEEGLAGIGPDILIQREAIELVNGKSVLKRYVLRWPKDFPKSQEDQMLTIINPSAKKDKRREIKGNGLDKYSKDKEVALSLIEQAKELVEQFNAQA